jgi:hypothetical protein
MSQHENVDLEPYHKLLGDLKDLLLLVLGALGPASPFEVIWGAIEALVVDAAGRIPDHAPGRPAEQDLADVDGRAAMVRSALHKAVADACQMAKLLAATDPRDPSCKRVHEQLGSR